LKQSALCRVLSTYIDALAYSFAYSLGFKCLPRITQTTTKELMELAQFVAAFGSEKIFLPGRFFGRRDSCSNAFVVKDAFAEQPFFIHFDDRPYSHPVLVP